METSPPLAVLADLALVPAGAHAAPRARHLYALTGDAFFLDLLRAVLEEGGYRVTTTPFAPVVFARIALARPALVLLDLALGQQAGWALLERLHAEAATRAIPVVVVSTQPAYLARAWDEVARFGSPSVMAMPFDIDDLLAVVRDALLHATAGAACRAEAHHCPRGYAHSCWARDTPGQVAGPVVAAPRAQGAAARPRDEEARRTIPADYPLYRPMLLPERLRTTARLADLHLGALTRTITYGDPQNGPVLTLTVGVGGGVADTSTPTVVHGQPGFINTFSNPFAEARVSWSEADQWYTIRGRGGVTLDELLAIANTLVPVGMDGRAEPRCFAATPYCVTGAFLGYWLGHGDLAINGYPLGDPFQQMLPDGRTYTVQYFERTRLETHPEQPDVRYQILLGQFGRQILDGVSAAPTAPVSAAPGSRHFSETGHNVAPAFLSYWEANGGLPQFGYPLSEAFTETLEDGQAYTVQYFERARFEHHPENPAPYDILLGQFGRRILAGASR